MNSCHSIFFCSANVIYCFLIFLQSAYNIYSYWNTISRNSLFFVLSVKFETQKFVEEELSNISIPEMEGKDGRFQYTITE